MSNQVSQATEKIMYQISSSKENLTNYTIDSIELGFKKLQHSNEQLHTKKPPE